MAASDWIEIYSTYTDEQLVAEQTELRKMAAPFSSQTIGSKSYTKDIREVRDRLQAIVRVRKNKSATSEDFSAVADFSGADF